MILNYRIHMILILKIQHKDVLNLDHCIVFAQAKLNINSSGVGVI